MSIIVSNCQHCDDQTTISNTVMCTLNDFLGITVRFIYTSTVTRSDSSLEKTTRTLRVHLIVIAILHCHKFMHYRCRRKLELKWISVLHVLI